MGRGLAAVLVLAAVLCGCTPALAPTCGPDPELERLLDAQLGVLADCITREERQAALELLAQTEPLRRSRIERGEYRKSERELRLLKRLNKLYEAYTVAYLNPEGESFGYLEPPERTLAVYDVGTEGELTPQGREPDGEEWTGDGLTGLWEQVVGWLPDGAAEVFSQVRFFTDGEYETVAYVQALDGLGRQWEFGIDPADSREEEYLLETVLHEYFHAVSLREGQVRYTARQTVDTYNEEGMVALPGSYLDAFYQAFWTDYLDDCLLCEDTYNFFLRHEEDFVTGYASTDPCEDLSESFTFYVLWDLPDGDMVWQRKLRFFENYPELTAMRAQVRTRLALDGAGAAGTE